MARYSVLHENPQLFQAKYVLYLPTKEELAKEIEQQKAIYMLQQGDDFSDFDKEIKKLQEK
jgi:hypothetical protein